jgi:spoIIIJ-associated protein
MTVYTAKTLEELLANAAADKNCSVEDLHYTVTEEKKGLLGIGNSVTAEVFNMDDVKEFLFDYLGNFFTSIDQDIEVAIEERTDGFIVNLNADNNAVLIG